VRPEAPTAFFSYSREDSDFALRLAKDLKAAGANVWIDQLDIEPGQEWDSAIEAAVAGCSRMLLILSPASVTSRNVRNEISFALDEHKTIVPVLHKNCTIPLQLRRIQYVDLRTDYPRGLTILLSTLGMKQRSAAVTTTTDPQASEMGGWEDRNVQEPDPLHIDNGVFVQRQRSDKPMSKYGRWAKAGLVLCTIVIAAFILSWNLLQRKASMREIQNRQAQILQTKPAESVTGAAPGARPPASSKSVASHQGSNAGVGATKANSEQSALHKHSAARPGGQSGNDHAMAPSGNETAEHNANSMQQSPSAVPAEGSLPPDPGPALANTYRRVLRGETYAMVSLGHCYESGVGVDKDYKRAVAWYRAAARSGNTFGMTSLGAMYEYGNGVDKDYKEAVNWYRKAAETGSDQGSRDGMYYLGTMYERGYGVEQDQQQAIAWYRKAAVLGLANAEEALKRLGQDLK
jgi:hypothetical protein